MAASRVRGASVAFAVFAVAVVLLIGGPQVQAGKAASSGCDFGALEAIGVSWEPVSEKKLLDEINAARAAAGVPPLGVDAALWQQATWDAGIDADVGQVSVTCSIANGFRLNATVPTGQTVGGGGSEAYAKFVLDNGAPPTFTDLQHYLAEGYSASDVAQLLSAEYVSVGIGLANGPDGEKVDLLLRTQEPIPPPAASLSTSAVTLHVPETFAARRRPTASGDLWPTIEVAAPGSFEVTNAKWSQGYLLPFGPDPLAFRYAPYLHFHGRGTITYTAADLYGNTASGTVTIVVGDGTSQTIKAPRSPARLGIGQAWGRLDVVQLGLLGSRFGRLSVKTTDGGKIALTVSRGSRTIGHKTLKIPRPANALIDWLDYKDPLGGGQPGDLASLWTIPLTRIVPRRRLSLGKWQLTARHDGRTTHRSFAICRVENAVTLNCGTFTLGGH